VNQYKPLLVGRPSLISFVTVAELRFGARRAGWGRARAQRLEAHIGTADIVWPDHDLVDVYAGLRHQCAATGHGLSQKEHEADRWVAATALWLGLPLVAHDGIFRDVSGLQLLTTLT
jgi:predicted nucleic acid-binding protein